MRKSIFAILVLLVLGIAVAGYPLNVLVLSNNDEIISLQVVKPNDTFLLGYFHSVALSDVWERFVIDADYRIVLTETMFQGQGAGLPSSLSDGEKLTRDGRWFRITGMRRIVPSLYWRVETRWHNRFRFNNEQEQDISSCVGDSLVLIRVQQMNVPAFLIHYLTGRTL
ncbi:MAG: DUF1850 domain-containing protein [Deltaproteobacteria bacterium]|nr:DUF1850 domain-containing protein [Deltaproteobacteria bacterium]MBW2306903.1 DUF1850 domain-containing protein [Deltaproteobacteria bacterium]